MQFQLEIKISVYLQNSFNKNIQVFQSLEEQRFPFFKL